MILGLGTDEPTVPLERTEFVRSDQKYSILTRIVRATQVDTIVHTFLETNSIAVPSRVLHEINVIGTLNLLAAAGTAGSSVRQVVVKSSTHVYGAAETDPTWFREEDDAHRPGADPAGAVAARGRGAGAGLRRGQPPPGGHGPAVRQRARHRHHHPDQPQPAQRLLPVHRRLRPAGPVRGGGRRGPGPRVRHRPSGPRACSTWPATGKLPWSEVAAIGGTLLLPLPPFRPRAFVAPVACGWARSSSPRRSRACSATAGAWTRRGCAATGFEYRYTSAGAVESFARANNLRRATGGPPSRRTATSRTWSSSSATRRRWSGASTARSGPGPGDRWTVPLGRSAPLRTRRPAARAR